MLMLAALGTAFYMSRLYFLVFSGDETRAPDEIKHHIHESPSIMVVPLVVLAVGATLVGFLGLPGGLLRPPRVRTCSPTSLEPVLGPELEVSAQTSRSGFMVVSTLLAVIGIGLAAVFYRGGYKEPARRFAAAFPGFVRLVQDKFRVDELYDVLIIRPIKRHRARPLPLRRPDHRRQDPGRGDRRARRRVLAARAGRPGRRRPALHGGVRGRRRGAGPLRLAADAAVHQAEGDADGPRRSRSTRAAAAARRQTRPLEYAFDFGDGRPVVKGTTGEQRHDYDRPGSYTIRVTVRDPRWGTEDGFKEKVEVQVMGLLAWITLLPLFGAGLVMLVPREEEAIHRGLGLLTALVTFVVSLLVLPDFDAGTRPASSWKSTRSGSRRSGSASTSASTASRCGWCC